MKFDKRAFSLVPRPSSLGSAGRGWPAKGVWLLLLVLLLLLAVPGWAGTKGPVHTKAPDFQLSDQYGNAYSRESFKGQVVVLLASDRGGEEQNHRWGGLLAEKYGDRVRIMGVADVRTVPFFWKAKIRRDFKKDKNAILLDWDGILFTSCGLAKGVSNVVLIDGSGIVRYVYSGSAVQGAVDDLFREIDRVLE